jgi:DNA-binding MurR/RpiR family transcriptional regulator
MEVADRIGQASASLTPAERRVAEVVLEHPQLVAFGTVADLAERSGSGAATVVRLASKLGFDGFTALQASVQHDLARQLRPAAERIREPAATDVIANHLSLEVENVRATLSSLEEDAVADVVGHLATTRSPLSVVSGDASHGIAMQFTADLSALRGNVGLIAGNEVAVNRQIGQLGRSDVVVLLDVRRYDRWLIDAANAARRTGAWLAAMTDSVLSPLASIADRTLVIAAAGAGPFDSHVGTLALCNLLVAGTADRLRAAATTRLDRAEAAWQGSGALVDR